MTTQFPMRFGKYLLLEKISTGGMAEVFRAKAFGVAGFEKSFALKRILPHISEDPEFVAMFIDEAKIAARLHHANICQIVEFGRVGDSYFQAMEYIPGADIRKIRRTLNVHKRPVPPEIAIYVVERVCDGLDYAHRKKDVRDVSLDIVHRDVSPQNILVSFEGGVKLIDFGIAKAANRAAKTQAGQIKGKFSYLSPEQITGQPIDGRVDIFALGVVFWEMLTGRDLFVANSEMEILRMIIRGDVPSPSRINPSLPKEIDSLVMQTLATNPDDRYPDAGVLHEEIQRFAYKLDMRVGTSGIQNFMTTEFAEDLHLEQEKVRRFLDMSKELRLPDGPYQDQVPNRSSDPVSVVTFSGRRLLPKTQRPQHLEPSDVTVIQGLSKDSDLSVQIDIPVSAQEDVENILELDDSDLVEIQEEHESLNYYEDDYQQQDDHQLQDDYQQQPDYQQQDDYQLQDDYQQQPDYQQQDDYELQNDYREDYGVENTQPEDIAQKQDSGDQQYQNHEPAPLQYRTEKQYDAFEKEVSDRNSAWAEPNPNEFDDEEPTKATLNAEEIKPDIQGVKALEENNFQEVDSSLLEEIHPEEDFQNEEDAVADEDATMFDPSIKPLIPVYSEQEIVEEHEQKDVSDQSPAVFDTSSKPHEPQSKEPEDLESTDGKDWSIQFNSPDDPVE